MVETTSSGTFEPGSVGTRNSRRYDSEPGLGRRSPGKAGRGENRRAAPGCAGNRPPEGQAAYGMTCVATTSARSVGVVMVKNGTKTFAAAVRPT